MDWDEVTVDLCRWAFWFILMRWAVGTYWPWFQTETTRKWTVAAAAAQKYRCKKNNALWSSVSAVLNDAFIWMPLYMKYTVSSAYEMKPNMAKFSLSPRFWFQIWGKFFNRLKEMEMDEWMAKYDCVCEVLTSNPFGLDLPAFQFDSDQHCIGKSSL